MAETADQKKIELPKKSFKAEFYVGLFAIIGVCAFGYLAINVARISIWKGGYYEVIAEFSNVAGLKTGAPVEIAGVEIGEVDQITLDRTSARVKMLINDGIPIRDDDIAQIRTKGIIGDRYIRISPGGSSDMLKSGQKLSDTESAVELEDVIGKFINRMD